MTSVTRPKYCVEVIEPTGLRTPGFPPVARFQDGALVPDSPHRLAIVRPKHAPEIARCATRWIAPMFTIGGHHNVPLSPTAQTRLPSVVPNTERQRYVPILCISHRYSLGGSCPEYWGER